ncbi:hypothetical protein ACFY8C_31320 [Streptomyces flavochromogenes]|uniref:Integrase n=1 Tax=Streptomyces flavochromogenes TaxID=68199 RepID=A0ABW6XZP6_9ACTN|nr:hypothetical protein [Streptomyces flavochromogenes]
MALEFLVCLDEHSLDLGGLRQDGLERWLDAGNTRTYAIRDFLSWTTSRGIIKASPPAGGSTPHRVALTRTNRGEPWLLPGRPTCQLAPHRDQLNRRDGNS